MRKNGNGGCTVTCPKCGSRNVNVQAVSITKTKRRGLFYWLFFGWFFDLLLWIFLFWFRLLIALFGSKRVKTTVKSKAVCQSCGLMWNT